MGTETDKKLHFIHYPISKVSRQSTIIIRQRSFLSKVSVSNSLAVPLSTKIVLTQDDFAGEMWYWIYKGDAQRGIIDLVLHHREELSLMYPINCPGLYKKYVAIEGRGSSVGRDLFIQ